MANLTKDQVREIIKNAPEGTSPAGIVASLRAKGHNLEGYPTSAPAPTPSKKTNGIISALKSASEATRQFATDLPVGIIKAGGDILYETGKLGGKVLEAGAQKLGAKPMPTSIPQVEKALEGKSIGEKVGKGIGTLASLITPVGIEAGVAELPALASKAAKFGKVAEAGKAVSSFLEGSRVARAALKGLAEGTEMATKSLAQTGDVKEAGITGAVTTALPIAGAVFRTPLTAAAERIYQSALKPTGKLKTKAEELAQTGLAERVWLTKGGVEKVAQKIDDFENQIGEAIEQAKAEGKKINITGMKGYIDEAKQWLSSNIDVAEADRDAKALDALYTNFVKRYGKEIPIDVAQQLKVATGQRLATFYEKMTDVASIEGLKQGTRFLKEEIATKAPVVGDVNKRLSKLYELDKALDNAKGRLGNLNLLGLGAKLGTATGGIPGMVLGSLADLADQAAIKSAGAISLNELAKLGESAGGSLKVPVSALIRLIHAQLQPKTPTE